MMDALRRRMVELKTDVALLGEPLAGLMPACSGRGHKTGRRPVGYLLEGEGMSTYTIRPVDERVFAQGEEGGCGKVWSVQEAGDGSSTVHVCSRPAGHGATLHRCESGCWWSGPAEVEGTELGQYLIWSLGRKKWMAPGFSGYVEAAQIAGAGRFGALEAAGACTRHETPMRFWAPTSAWPSPVHPLPAIKVPESAVLEVAHNGATLQKVIHAAARWQVPGWDEYWAEIGEVYEV